MNLNFTGIENGIKKRLHLSAFQKIILGFALLILFASLILMLPIASRDGVWTPFIDCLFTATSATCVTGLVVHDTATYWSEFGQVIIIILIQIGGMGVITLGSMLMMFARKKIGLAQQSAMQESIAAPEMGGVVGYTRFILKCMMGIELFGAILLMPVMISDFGLKGIWYAFFHSISAFCNAGFDLMGVREQFSSLTAYAGDIYINTVIMFLIVAGGIGFLTWDDIAKHKFDIRRYHMQTKVVLITTLVLLVFPTIFFYFSEFSRDIWGDMSDKDRWLVAAFQAVTTRTAGFNTVDLAQFSGATVTVFVVLMLVGGSPGSTAGGMKTTTLAVMFMSMKSTFRRKEHTTCFGRRIEDDIVKNAAAILMMYVILFLTGTIIINLAEGLPFTQCIFEVASAIGTVGVTMGITTSLGTLSRVVIIILMFLGRVGGLTLIYATVAPPKTQAYKLPKEKITVG